MLKLIYHPRTVEGAYNVSNDTITHVGTSHSAPAILLQYILHSVAISPFHTLIGSRDSSSSGRFFVRKFEEVCMSWAFKTGLFDKEEQQSWGWSIPQNVYGDAWGSRSNHESSWAFTPVNSASQDSNNFFSTPGTAQGATSWSFSSVSLATNYAFSTIPISNYGQEPIRNWGDPPGLLANTWASKIAEPAKQSSWNPAPANRLRRR